MGMYQVRTDHQVVAFGADCMKLFQNSDGSVIAEATRDGSGGWTVKAEGVPDMTVGTRVQAIKGLQTQALLILPGTGYSTLIPHGLREMP